MSTERHELWDELEAFDPKWQLHYDTTHDAAIAANVVELWQEYCQSNPHRRQSMACLPRQVPDTVGAIRKQQEAAQSTSLPYRLDTIGSVRQSRE